MGLPIFVDRRILADGHRRGQAAIRLQQAHHDILRAQQLHGSRGQAFEHGRPIQRRRDLAADFRHGVEFLGLPLGRGAQARVIERQAQRAADGREQVDVPGAEGLFALEVVQRDHPYGLTATAAAAPPGSRPRHGLIERGSPVSDHLPIETASHRPGGQAHLTLQAYRRQLTGAAVG
jgi:hypothetical protein